MITRADYMAGKADHQAYYEQFETPALKRAVLTLIGKKAILASTDPHLNDIPLRKWDQVSRMCREEIVHANLELNGQPTYCLSDGVCAAKAYARKFAREVAA